MNQLFIIDPQNDFMDLPGSALGVQGALQDMARLARFVDTAGHALAGITVTLDSHPAVAIERPSFWVTAEGKPVAPWTTISADEVRAGRFLPSDLSLTEDVVQTLQALEARGRYRLMVWPAHCIEGSPGHGVEPGLQSSLKRWESATGRRVAYVRKGMNPLTEHYSAFEAEVPRPGDPDTLFNEALAQRLLESNSTVFIAGEAASHCVAASVDDLLSRTPSAEASRLVMLTDCMSPVSGFEADAIRHQDRVSAHGVQIMTTSAAVARLTQQESQ